MSVLGYATTMIFLSVVWLISWEFMRQENRELRGKNRKLRETVTYLYGEIDRYRPKRNVKGKLVNVRDWMER